MNHYEFTPEQFEIEEIILLLTDYPNNPIYKKIGKIIGKVELYEELTAAQWCKLEKLISDNYTELLPLLMAVEFEDMYQMSRPKAGR